MIFKGWAYNRAVDSVFEVFRLEINTTNGNSFPYTQTIPFVLNPTDVLYFTADTDVNDTRVSGRFSVVQYLE